MPKIFQTMVGHLKEATDLKRHKHSLRKFLDVQHTYEHRLKKLYVAESVNYEQIDTEDARKAATQPKRWKPLLLRGLFTFLSATTIALCTTVLVASALQLSEKLHYLITHNLLQAPGKSILWRYGMVLLATLGLGLGASLLSTIYPAVGGSGLPEVIAFLNGVVIRPYLKFRVLALKYVAMILAVTSGLFIDMEAPIIHLGTLTAVSVGRMFLNNRWLRSLYAENSKSSLKSAEAIRGAVHQDETFRVYAAAGAAVGMSVALRAPVGGVAFVLEEATSFFKPTVIFQTMYMTIFAYWAFLGFLKFSSVLHLVTDTMAFFYNVECSQHFLYHHLLWDILLGVICGLLGRVIIFLTLRLQSFRKKYTRKSAFLRLMEVTCMIILTTSAATFTPLIPGIDKCNNIENAFVTQFDRVADLCGGHCESSGPMYNSSCFVAKAWSQCLEGDVQASISTAAVTNLMGKTRMQCPANQGNFSYFGHPDRVLVSKKAFQGTNLNHMVVSGNFGAPGAGHDEIDSTVMAQKIGKVVHELTAEELAEQGGVIKAAEINTDGSESGHGADASHAAKGVGASVGVSHAQKADSNDVSGHDGAEPKAQPVADSHGATSNENVGHEAAPPQAHVQTVESHSVAPVVAEVAHVQAAPTHNVASGPVSVNAGALAPHPIPTHPASAENPVATPPQPVVAHPPVSAAVAKPPLPVISANPIHPAATTSTTPPHAPPLEVAPAPVPAQPRPITTQQSVGTSSLSPSEISISHPPIAVPTGTDSMHPHRAKLPKDHLTLATGPLTNTAHPAITTSISSQTSTIAPVPAITSTTTEAAAIVIPGTTTTHTPIKSALSIQQQDLLFGGSGAAAFPKHPPSQPVPAPAPAPVTHARRDVGEGEGGEEGEEKAHVRVARAGDGGGTGDPCYYQMRSLLWVSSHGTIRHLFEMGVYDLFDATNLLVFLAVYTPLAILATGLALPAGMVVPIMVVGAAGGRLLGLALNAANAGNTAGMVDPGGYAMIGAAGLWTGVMQIPLTATVVMFETSGLNSTPWGAELLVVVLIATFVSRMFGLSLYHTEMHETNIPFLDFDPDPSLGGMDVSHIMSAPAICVKKNESVQRARSILSETTHNAYPVVDDDGVMLGLLLREELEMAFLNFLKSTGGRWWEGVGMLSLGDSHSSPTTVQPTERASHAYYMLRQLGLRYITVVDKNHRPVGMLTRKDFMHHRHEHDDDHDDHHGNHHHGDQSHGAVHGKKHSKGHGGSDDGVQSESGDDVTGLRIVLAHGTEKDLERKGSLLGPRGSQARSSQVEARTDRQGGMGLLPVANLMSFDSGNGSVDVMSSLDVEENELWSEPKT